MKTTPGILLTLLALLGLPGPAGAQSRASGRIFIGGAKALAPDGSSCIFAGFALRADGKQATGTDVWQLIEIDGEWKIVSLSYTNRPL